MKANFSGHCQACGRLQKLPNDRLSKHGYNVEHGFFSGTCEGSGALPFEKSCGLIEQFISRSKGYLLGIETTQAALRVPATEPKAWMRVRYDNPKGRLYRSVYKWELVQLAVEFKPFQDQNEVATGKADQVRGYLVYTYTDSLGNVHGNHLGRNREDVSGVNLYDEAAKGKTHNEILLLTATRFNEKYANWMEHEAKSLRDYIAWQTKRVNTWVEADLLPVAHKDKEGFVVTAAPY